MKIQSITISGFKNLAKTRLNLEGIVGIVSPNNYGKSNLLNAIQYGFTFLTQSPKDRRRMMASVANMPLVPELNHADFEFQIEFEDKTLGQYRFVRYGFRFGWQRDDHSGAIIKDEILETNSKQTGQWTAYLKRQEGKYRSCHETRSWRKIHLDDDQLAIDVLTAIDDIGLNPVVLRIKNLQLNMSGAIDADPCFQPMFPIEFVQERPEDIFAKQLHLLKEQNPNLFETFQENIYELFPEFKRIWIETLEISPEERKKISNEYSDELKRLPLRIRDEIYRVVVASRHLNQPVSMRLMSAGTKRIVWLLANILIAAHRSQGNALLAVEEVETSIHPRLMKALLETLHTNLDSKTNLLVTSHSPFLIQYLKPQNIYVGIPSDTGVARFGAIKKNRIKELLNAANARRIGYGEYLFQLMAESGVRDQILNTYLDIQEL